ncbi:MAG: hypothetical protein ACXABY_22715 [Candidatus Thorarchaeota archaeon]|jgi:hypothetical protein
MEERFVPEITPVCMEEGVRVFPYIHFDENTLGFNVWVHFEEDWSIGVYSITMDIEGVANTLAI